MANVSFSAAGDTLYAYLSGEIDHDAAQDLRLALDDALVSRSPRTLVLDFAGVGFMDSSGVGLILGRQRRAQALGGSVRVQHAPRQLRRVLDLARIPCTAQEGGTRKWPGPAGSIRDILVCHRQRRAKRWQT